jgi:hypothetical protein
VLFLYSPLPLPSLLRPLSFVNDTATLSEAMVVPYTPPSSLGGYTDESEGVREPLHHAPNRQTKRFLVPDESSSLSSVSHLPSSFRPLWPPSGFPPVSLFTLQPPSGSPPSFQLPFPPFPHPLASPANLPPLAFPPTRPLLDPFLLPPCSLLAPSLLPPCSLLAPFLLPPCSLLTNF